MIVEVTEMSVPAADDAHEFVVAPELAEVADCLAVPLHTGDRVRFDLIEGAQTKASHIDARRGHRHRSAPSPPTTYDQHLAEHAHAVIRAELSDQ